MKEDFLEDSDEIYKVVRVNGHSEFTRRKENLIKMKESFEVESSGAASSIIHNGFKFICADNSDFAGKGFHLSKMVKKDVSLYVQEHGDLPHYSSNYMEQMFDLENLRRASGKLVTSIDINNCYWRTAYKLGYITHKTYLSGNRDKSWKIGRNASVGSLAKHVRVTKYKDGKPDYIRSYDVKPDQNFVNARNHIIGYVHKMFEEVRTILGDEFYMFLTDCVFTDTKNIGRVKKFFKSHGYTVKTKPVEFTSIDIKNKAVHWLEFPEFKNELKADFSNHEQIKRKYYQYATHQLVRTQTTEIKFENYEEE